MRESQLNSSIQPIKLAKKEGEVRFSWKVEDFERLVELLYSNEGSIGVEIQGRFDDHRRCLLEAKITADVTLECQTTFTPIKHQIEKEITYCAVVAESQFAEAEEEFEPVLMEEGYLDIKQVIEDELILSIPIVANKPLEELDKQMSFGELDEEAIKRDKEANNPFAVLKDLKKT